jgi:hypothetical protein
MIACRFAVFAFLCLLTCADRALAWGRDGHETVGYIAARVIAGSRAEAEVAKILEPGESLATAAEWPDCAKGYQYCQAPLTEEMKQYARDNPAHHAYHYTDVPIQRLKYTPSAAGTGPNDIVHALQDAIRVLRGGSPEEPGHVFTKRTALFVVAHMVGDIHQPLHVGAAYVDDDLKFADPHTQAEVLKSGTEGGNWLCIGSKGLHSNWDTAYVKAAMKLPAYHVASSEEFAAQLLTKAEPVPSDAGDPEDWPAKWAGESLALSRIVLSQVTVSEQRMQDPRGGCGKPDDSSTEKVAWTITLPAGYGKTAATTVPQQLVRAGTRLGRLLMVIWPDQQAQ